MIIYINHIHYNWLSQFSPSRLGFGDAAEVFIFLSGYASALAYGRAFKKYGFKVGCRRVASRCWDLYIAHLAIFFILVLICLLGNQLFTSPNYIGRLNLWPLFKYPDQAIAGLLTLTYVPNYFDILPMYIVALAMIPVVVYIGNIRPALVLLLCGGLYLTVWLSGFNLPAEFWSDRGWFFNPFCWQLVFFMGFAISIGWLTVPAVSGWLVALCCLFLVASAWLCYGPAYTSAYWLEYVHDTLDPYRQKSTAGPLRWLHFLAMAYLAVVLLKGREVILHRNWARPLVIAGQNSLPVFMTSLAMSYLAAMVLDRIGREPWTSTLVSLGGAVLLVGSGYLFAWRKRRVATAKRVEAVAGGIA